MKMLFDQTDPVDMGWLPEEDGHSVAWRAYGQKDQPAIVLLHGGPGAGTSDRMHRLFDPEKWYIITMDQRGSGLSTPYAGYDLAALEFNTTAHLISDIERLRCHLGIKQWTVYGGSWGTAIAIAYTYSCLPRVTGLILSAINTVSAAELEMLYGIAGKFLPAAFQEFTAKAPHATSVAARIAAC